MMHRHNETPKGPVYMLRSLKDLEGYEISATDGLIGHVSNFLFDDERWTIRYLVVRTSGFLDRHEVLISPISIRTAEWAPRRIHLALTVAKIKGSPDIDAHKSVTRQREQEYHCYYGYPYYWGSMGLWGMGTYPGLLATVPFKATPTILADAADAHLRSESDVRGYHIEGSDGAIGHVADFVVDDESWAIRYLAIDTSNWWIGKKVLVAPHWAKRISWDEQQVHVAMSRQAIKDSPPWDANAPVNREYETRLYDYYGRPAYWSDELRAKAAPIHPPL